MQIPMRLLVCSLGLMAGAVALGEEPKTGSLKGTVRVTGEVPNLPVLGEKGDGATKGAAVCAAAADTPDESLLVNDKENNGLASVAIWMRQAPKGYQSPEPSGDATLRIKDCRFVPRILPVRVQQRVVVRIDDKATFNVHDFPVRNHEFGRPIQSQQEFRYKKPEHLPVVLKDDLHSWMKGHFLVTDHPFVAISNSNGTFEIKGIPPGTHDFSIWHERPGWLEKTKTIEIRAGETTTLDLTYDIEVLKPKR